MNESSSKQGLAIPDAETDFISLPRFSGKSWTRVPVTVTDDVRGTDLTGKIPFDLSHLPITREEPY